MNVLPRLAAFVICVACAHAGAETYTFIGPSNGLWSNPLNWAGGIVPVSAVDSTIVNASGVQDLAAEFNVGSLVNPSGISSGSIRVYQSVSNDYSPFGGVDFSHLTLVDGVTLIDEVDVPELPIGYPREGSMIANLTLANPLNFSGGWRADHLGGSGSIHLNDGASLDARVYDLQLNSLTGSGYFDLKGSSQMTGGVPADLTGGTVDLGRQDSTIGTNIIGEMTIDGDLKLGAFFIYGNGGPWPQGLDKIHVTGELDLTQASIHPQSLASVNMVTYPPADHLLIATYGNRIGAFPDTMVPYFWYSGPCMTPMYLHYTSPENSGPGEVWLVVPEPTCTALIALIAPIALRRFRVASGQ